MDFANLSSLRSCKEEPEGKEGLGMAGRWACEETGRAQADRQAGRQAERQPGRNFGAGWKL